MFLEIKNGLAEIGDWTYGNPKIMRWDTTDKLKVGKFSSIGPGVTIIFGGNHRQDWVTTSPLPADTFQAFNKFSNVKDVKDFTSKLLFIFKLLFIRISLMMFWHKN